MFGSIKSIFHVAKPAGKQSLTSETDSLQKKAITKKYRRTLIAVKLDKIGRKELEDARSKAHDLGEFKEMVQAIKNRQSMRIGNKEFTNAPYESGYHPLSDDGDE